MKKCVSKLFLDRKGRQRMKAKCKAALTKMTIQVDPWGTKSFRICIHRRRRCCGRTIRDRLLLLAKLNCNGSGKTFETVKQLSVHKKHNFTEPGKVRRALNLHRESLTCLNFLGVLVVSLKLVIQTPVSLKKVKKFNLSEFLADAEMQNVYHWSMRWEYLDWMQLDFYFP